MTLTKIVLLSVFAGLGALLIYQVVTNEQISSFEINEAAPKVMLAREPGV